MPQPAGPGHFPPLTSLFPHDACSPPKRARAPDEGCLERTSPPYPPPLPKSVARDGPLADNEFSDETLQGGNPK
eukprot:1449919-Prymnesium_polylepis.1